MELQLLGLPIFVLILGIIGELFKPALPFNIPQRGFGVYSWLVLLQSQACGLGHVPYARANWTLRFRGYGLRRLMSSIIP